MKSALVWQVTSRLLLQRRCCWRCPRRESLPDARRASGSRDRARTSRAGNRLRHRLLPRESNRRHRANTRSGEDRRRHPPLPTRCAPRRRSRPAPGVRTLTDGGQFRHTRADVYHRPSAGVLSRQFAAIFAGRHRFHCANTARAVIVVGYRHPVTFSEPITAATPATWQEWRRRISAVLGTNLLTRAFFNSRISFASAVDTRRPPAGGFDPLPGLSARSLCVVANC